MIFYDPWLLAHKSLFIKFIKTLLTRISSQTIDNYPIVQPVIYTDEVKHIYSYLHGVNHNYVIKEGLQVNLRISSNKYFWKQSFFLFLSFFIKQLN